MLKQPKNQNLIITLPICCNCQKIRDAQGNWHDLETYLRRHLGLGFTHGLCRDCATEIISGAAEGD